MFDFSFSELLIIGIVAVIVFDPRHLPDVARSAGRWMGRARRYMNKVKEDLDEQVGTEHLAPLRELNDEWQRTRSLLEESVVPREWSVGDDSPDGLPPPSAAGRESSTPANRAPRRRRHRRRGRARASSGAPNIGKSHGGGEGA